jgi:SAM-dependent methyltransferase
VSVLAVPPGKDTVPPFEDGWLIGENRRAPYLSYAQPGAVNWSDELERLHEESSRTHFLDLWTRAAILEQVGNLPKHAIVLDLGCSTGHLVQDLRGAYPEAILIGVDLIASGLEKAHALVPSARLVQADACDLPLAEHSVDVVVSANMLEHVPDDRNALAEIRRVLRPGGRAALVVPSGARTYDYYDRFLGHERRYARGELARKASDAGLEVIHDGYIASLLYPPFWLLKRRNRRRYDRLEGDALAERVAHDIATTRGSRVARGLWRVEQRLALRLPFGIRNLVVLRRGLQ